MATRSPVFLTTRAPPQFRLSPRLRFPGGAQGDTLQACREMLLETPFLILGPTVQALVNVLLQVPCTLVVQD